MPDPQRLRTGVLARWLLALLLAATGLSVAADELGSVSRAITEGHYAAAKSMAERLLDELERLEPPDPPAVARVLDFLVEVAWRTRVVTPEARAAAKRAVEIRERAFGADSLEFAASLRNEGQIHLAAGELVEARSCFERALAIQSAILAPDDPDVATTLWCLGNIAHRDGDFAKAVDYHQRALTVREASLGPDAIAVADSLAGVATAKTMLGRAAEVRPIMERSLAITEQRLGMDHVEVAGAAHNLGDICRAMGDLPAARKHLQRALEIRQRELGADSPLVGATCHTLAMALRDTSDYVTALEYAERALQIREKAFGTRSDITASSMNLVGSLYTMLGRRDEARRLFEKTLEIRTEIFGPEHMALADSLNSLANVLLAMDDPAAAVPYLERALALIKANLGERHPFYAISTVNLVVARYRSGQFAKADSLLGPALDTMRASLGPNHSQVAYTLVLQAKTRWALGDHAGALDLALGAEGSIRGHFVSVAPVLSEREALLYESYRTSGLHLALTALVAWPGGPPEDRVRRVWDHVVRSRGMVLDEIIARHPRWLTGSDPSLRDRQRRFESAQSRLARLRVQGRDPKAPEAYAESLREAERENDEAERGLAERSPWASGLTQRRQTGLADVEDRLPPDTALVAYVRYGELVPPRWIPSPEGTAARQPQTLQPEKATASYAAFVLNAGGDVAVVSLGGAARIEELVEGWRSTVGSAPSQLREGSRAADAAYRLAATKLREAIWDPVVKAAGLAKTVLIVPEGALQLVSFATLQREDGAYLVESGPLLHYLSAEKDLIGPAVASVEGHGLLVLGGPDFDSAGPTDAPAEVEQDPAIDGFRSRGSDCDEFRSLRFQGLPGARAEVNEIASLWTSERTADEPAEGSLELTGRRASEEAFKRLAPRHRVLHLATHGFFVAGKCLAEPEGSGSPLRLSGLALAGANRREEIDFASGAEDGVLVAEEIGALDLSGVEWVVLSACDTGLGEIVSGEGVLGLRRAFQVAGARTLIMSLWSVEDVATRSWMRGLYLGRLQGLSTAEAVRRASVAEIANRRNSGQSTHPFYWGAMVATGDWR